MEKAQRFSPFPHLSGRYGAPMGRADTANQPFPADADLCVSKPQGEYDSGGAYWGYSPRRSEGGEGPVYAVWVRGKGKALGVRYVRAFSEAEAAQKAREE